MKKGDLVEVTFPSWEPFDSCCQTGIILSIASDGFYCGILLASGEIWESMKVSRMKVINEEG